MLTAEQIERYLGRIAYFETRESTAEVLRKIQLAHLQAVPFEALDICPLGIRFSIDPLDVYEKVVVRKRGGYCFELNGLAATLLESLGYSIERMSARFTNSADQEHDQFDHMTLHVTVPDDDSRWFFDVAAGRLNPDQPVPLDGETDDGKYRTRLIGDFRHFEISDEADGWIPQMAWTTIPRTIDDFRARSDFFQDDPNSFFRNGPLCTILLPVGRLTLSKWNLITTIGDERTEQRLTSTLEVQAILAEWFGIDLALDNWWDGQG